EGAQDAVEALARGTVGAAEAAVARVRARGVRRVGSHEADGRQAMFVGRGAPRERPAPSVGSARGTCRAGSRTARLARAVRSSTLPASPRRPAMTDLKQHLLARLAELAPAEALALQLPKDRKFGDVAL